MVRTKVFVGNLSFQTKEAELATEFAVAGKVISANIITRGPRSLGYGFVEFDSEEDAQNAVNLLSKKEINGRAVNVEIAKPQDETKRQPRPPRPEGENGAPRRPRPRKSFRKKEGEEGEKKPQESKKEEAEEEIPRRRPRPRRTNRVSGGGNPGERRIPTEDREESKTTLFVANLPFSLDDAAFAKIVTDLNLKLKSAHVVKKRNGRSKGYGFIEFDSQDDQQKALAALNKKVVDSRELSVKVALTEIKHESAEQQQQQQPPKEAKPVENKVASPEKKTAPVEKKPVPVAAEKKSSPAPVVAEKKSSPAPVVAEKKASPAPVVAEKKTSPAPEKKASPAPQEKKTPSTEKKQEAKSPEKDEKKK